MFSCVGVPCCVLLCGIIFSVVIFVVVVVLLVVMVMMVVVVMMVGGFGCGSRGGGGGGGVCVAVMVVVFMWVGCWFGVDGGGGACGAGAGRFVAALTAAVGVVLLLVCCSVLSGRGCVVGRTNRFANTCGLRSTWKWTRAMRRARRRRHCPLDVLRRSAVDKFRL